MAKYFPRRVLITQGELINYAGSELVTLELAEYLASRGAQVEVLSNFIDFPIKQDFLNLKQVTIHTSSKDINFRKFDLIWIQHQLLPKEIIELAQDGKLKAKVVFHHMSSFHPLEFPFGYRIEKFLADKILYSSLLTKTTIESKLSDKTFIGEVFNNPAPEVFKVDPSTVKYSPKLNRILVVSNHLPEELQKVITLLEHRGINVRTMGLSLNRQPRRVMPSDIFWADCIISIGKTVTYAIRAAKPVYCYDYFGALATYH